MCGLFEVGLVGHHVGRNGRTPTAPSSGFCLLNNVVIGALHARMHPSVTRVAVLDWDIHHGNGTEELLRGDPRSFFASIHLYHNDFFPGTGPTASDANIVNVGLQNAGLGSGSEYDDWLLFPAMEAFQPDIIFISAGFDGHKDDILGGCAAVSNRAVPAGYVEAHQNLRIGVGSKSVVMALAHSFADADADKPSLQPWVASVAAAYSQRPIFEDLVETLGHVLALPSLDAKAGYIRANTAPKPGTPVQTMLGYPVSTLHQITQRMRKYAGGVAACEYKYDGARLQIHVSKRTVSHMTPTNEGPDLAVFSRNCERIPADHKYFDTISTHVVPYMNAHVESIIVEGEMVAVADDQTQQLLPFQTLQTNGHTAMCLFAFDCLYLNGTSLVHRPFQDRRAALHAAFTPPSTSTTSTLPGQPPRSPRQQLPQRFQFVQSQDVSFSLHEDPDTDENEDLLSNSPAKLLQNVLQAAVDADCEGLMVKALDEPYKPGCRTHTWLKVKRDYLPATPCMASGMFLPDSLDLVPIAAFRGKGRRAHVFGSFLLACYDPTTQLFHTVGKVGSGFTDVDLAAISKRLEDTVVAVKPLEYDASEVKSIQPDVWFEPTEVWEIRAAQLTKSVKYTAGSTYLNAPSPPPPSTTSNTSCSITSRTDAHKSCGLGLRFPRFLAVRRDKAVVQATSDDQLASLYLDSQTNNLSMTIINDDHKRH
ncbi:hypothetical protein B5M09_001740 [Aphanomyces astaci]|uniref:DNA ligase 1 n=1 Tax=Aphanomyces astaci TaxID=112090 RepID=A0A425D4H1_APHAT|nr:hypothetical protein B5M09_001740 [Aphanomyces astaci]